MKTDVTDELGRLRNRVAELEARLASTSLERNQAERCHRALAKVLGEASHEIRTPLSALQLQLDRLWHKRDHRFGTKELELLGRCLRSTSRIRNLVDTLQEYANFQRGAFEMKVESFDLAELSDEVVEELQSFAVQKGVEIRSALERNRCMVTSDRGLVRLIVLNLLASTVKNADHGVVQVTLRANRGGFHRFRVVTRPSCAPGQAVLKPSSGVSLVEAMRKQPSHVDGLGLRLVREMIVALGGCIESDTGESDPSAVVALIPAH